MIRFASSICSPACSGGEIVNPTSAADVLGVPIDAPWTVVRRAYRDRMRRAHPDAGGTGDAQEAVLLNRAYATLEELRRNTVDETPLGDGSTSSSAGHGEAQPIEVVGVLRLATDTLAIALPGDEAFRLVFDAAHDIGDITYLDGSGPLLEVLCRFVGEPATSLLLTFQGRAAHTEIHGTVESIEARPAPPTAAVVDLLEDALRSRLGT